MFHVKKFSHENYGDIIIIEHVENGLLPLQACQLAFKEHKLWQQNSNKIIRFMVDDQILTSSQLERWAEREYKELPKCFRCAQILNGEVYPGTFYGKHFYCSTNCRDQDFREEMEKIDDDRECDFA
jgi:hypothetical protein